MITTNFSRPALTLLAALALSAGTAQGQTRLPLDKAVLAPEAAQRAGSKTQISVDTARAIVDACVAYAKANNASYSIYVLGPAGEMVQTHVMEGQLPIGVETALMKAQTALYVRAPSSEVAERYAQAGVQSYMQR